MTWDITLKTTSWVILYAINRQTKIFRLFYKWFSGDFVALVHESNFKAFTLPDL
jgi:hypothetical protein